MPEHASQQPETPQQITATVEVHRCGQCGELVANGDICLNGCAQTEACD